MKRAPLFAALLGAATVFGFAPFYWFPLPVFTLVALTLLWQRAPHRLAVALLGFCFGLGEFLAGVSWVYVSLHDFGAMPALLAAPLTLLFCAGRSDLSRAWRALDIHHACGAARPVDVRGMATRNAYWISLDRTRLRTGT